jgi:hypothetical protein
MTDKLLREAAQNILNGIETGAIKIETDQDESWANALSALRSALAQSESEPDKLEKAARAIYDMMPFDGVGSEKKPAWVEGGNSLDEARRYARTALAQPEGWQPIETAPKDGSLALHGDIRMTNDDDTAPCSKHHRLGQNWMGQHPPSPCRHA